LNGQWAIITINNNDTSLVTPVPAWVALVSLANSPSFSLDALFESGEPLDRAIASDNWLLVASGTSLDLYDITSLQTPVLVKSFSASSSTTSLVAVPNGLFVITNNGYGFLDVSDTNNITFTETADLDIKGSKKAYLIGNKLYIGGPSKFVGSIKIARLDISSPGSPAIDLLNDQIQGTLADFAFDGSQSYFVLKANSVQLFQENNNTLSLNKSASLTSSTFSTQVSKFYAHTGRFYVLKSGTMQIYRMQ
jgi:hypothetical protein